ncbi:MAG: YfbK domain-containing protein, partial [Ilyomonas sp.]
GNGNFAYIDDLDEGEQVLVQEFSKTMYSVADDAFLSVKFNPAVVNQYRLIGFDNKKDALEDSTTQFIGGEIGSGHTLIAVFEIEPTGKYRENVTGIDAMLADLQLQYKLPSTNVSRSQHFEIPLNYVALEKADSCYRFAASVTMFGSLLRQSKYAKNYSWDDVKALALSASAPGNFLQQQFIELIEKAKKIYSDKKKGLFSVKF